MRCTWRSCLPGMKAGSQQPALLQAAQNGLSLQPPQTHSTLPPAARAPLLLPHPLTRAIMRHIHLHQLNPRVLQQLLCGCLVQAVPSSTGPGAWVGVVPVVANGSTFLGAGGMLHQAAVPHPADLQRGSRGRAAGVWSESLQQGSYDTHGSDMLLPCQEQPCTPQLPILFPPWTPRPHQWSHSMGVSVSVLLRWSICCMCHHCWPHHSPASPSSV